MLPNTNLSIAHVADDLGLNIYDLATLRKHPNNNRWGFNNFTAPVLNLWGAPLPTSEFRLGDYRGYEHTRRACSFGLIQRLGNDTHKEIRIILGTFPSWSERPDHDITYTFAVYLKTDGAFQHSSTYSRTLVMTQSPGNDVINGSIYLTMEDFTDLASGETGYVWIKLLSCSEDRRFDINASMIDGFNSITPQGLNLGEGYIIPLIFVVPVEGKLSVQIQNSTLLLGYSGQHLTGISMYAANNTFSTVSVRYNIKGVTDAGEEFFGTNSITLAPTEHGTKNIGLYGAVTHLSKNTVVKIYSQIDGDANWTYLWDCVYTREEELN